MKKFVIIIIGVFILFIIPKGISIVRYNYSIKKCNDSSNYYLKRTIEYMSKNIENKTPFNDDSIIFFTDKFMSWGYDSIDNIKIRELNKNENKCL